MKKSFYLTLTTLLGILSGGVIITLAERWIINNALSQGACPVSYSYIYEPGYVPQFFSTGMVVLGAMLGFFLGRKWWRIVYIEKRHWRKKN